MKRLLVFLFCFNLNLFAGGHGGSHSSSRHSSLGSGSTHIKSYSATKSYSTESHATSSATHSISSSTHHYTPPYSSSSSRDSHGKIERSSSAKHEFMKETGYQHGRKGYVIDHVVPLSKGGADAPGNMQWQTVEEGKAKDKWERGQTHTTKKKMK